MLRECAMLARELRRAGGRAADGLLLALTRAGNLLWSFLLRSSALACLLGGRARLARDLRRARRRTALPGLVRAGRRALDPLRLRRGGRLRRKARSFGNAAAEHRLHLRGPRRLPAPRRHAGAEGGRRGVERVRRHLCKLVRPHLTQPTEAAGHEAGGGAPQVLVVRGLLDPRQVLGEIGCQLGLHQVICLVIKGSEQLEKIAPPMHHVRAGHDAEDVLQTPASGLDVPQPIEGVQHQHILAVEVCAASRRVLDDILDDGVVRLLGELESQLCIAGAPRNPLGRRAVRVMLPKLLHGRCCNACGANGLGHGCRLCWQHPPHERG
mmetsp:Transcript_16897/g.52974  ORF Transcript_16897/g.52974 Transcript_16897/m.52974 type:complete len:324 (-) Transcript_16897:36-1007(-)